MKTIRDALAASVFFLCLAGAGFAPRDAAAESIKIGIVKVGASGPVYVAYDKGYFTAQGLEAELVYFDGPESIPVGLVSGSIDVGAGPIGAALYTLGGQGAVRIIGGLNRYHRDFHAMAMMASNRAWSTGLKSAGDFGGHSFAVSQFGTSPQYSLSRLAEIRGIDVKSIRVVALQSAPNIAAALTGGQVDSAILPIIIATPLIARDQAKLIGWLDDEVGLQNGVIEVATKTADTRPDMIKRFLTGYRKGAREYYDAFTGPDDEPRMGPNAPAVMALIDKYTGQTTTTALGASYIDPEAKVDVEDVYRQIAWFKSVNMVKPDLDANQIVDKRYVVPLR